MLINLVTGMEILAWIAGGLGLVGIVFMGIAALAPHSVHLFRVKTMEEISG